MVGNHTGEGEVGVSRGKGTEHIEVDGRPKRGVEIASQGTDTIRAEIHGKAVRLPVVADPDRGGARRCPCEPCGLKSAVGPLHGDAALAIDRTPYGALQDVNHAESVVVVAVVRPLVPRRAPREGRRAPAHAHPGRPTGTNQAPPRSSKSGRNPPDADKMAQKALPDVRPAHARATCHLARSR